MFMTINKVSPVLGIPTCALRRMQKEGSLPGFFSGNRFYVNVDALRVQLGQTTTTAPQNNAEGFDYIERQN